MGFRRTRSWLVVELAILGLSGLCAATPIAAAAGPNSCLSQDERRVIIASRQAVPLARAMHVVKARIPGDVVKVRLCRQEIGLVYVLTVLARNGMVMQARVDAADGRWLGPS